MLVSIDKIIVKDRIRKDFGDISELAQDIKENGLINPPVVIPEQDGTFTLLAGERRLRAMKSLGKTDIEVRPWKTLTDEEKLNIEISENVVRKQFSWSETIEAARRKQQIVAAEAKERQEATRFGSETVGQNSDTPGRTDDTIAHELGVSRDTYRRAQTIVDNKDLISAKDFADWDEGKLSTNKAFQKVKAEQARLKAELDRQKAENTALKNRPPETVTVTKEVEVVPDDYESVKRENAQVNAEYQRMAEKWKEADAERQALLKEKESSQHQEEEHIRQTALAFNAGIANFIERYGGYVWLTERVDEMPERERKGFIKGLDALEAWVNQMQENISRTNKEELLHE